MKQTHYLIIGGGIAGTTAAETIRSHDKKNTVTIVSAEPLPLYSRISLSKEPFFLGKLTEEDIFIHTSSWYKKNSIALLYGESVRSLDTDMQVATLSDGQRISYTKLLLATGGDAEKHEEDTGLQAGVYYLRTLSDTKKILSSIKNAKRAVIVGCGFISFEMCDLLRKKKVDTSAVYRRQRYFGHILDNTASDITENALSSKDVSLYPDRTIRSFNGSGTISSVTLSDGTMLEADMVICGLGSKTSTDLPSSANIECNSGILVNEFLETSKDHVWSAGDSAEFYDTLLNDTHQLGNWGNAHMQGRAAGYNMTHEIPKAYSMITSYTSKGAGVILSFVGDVRSLQGRRVISRGPSQNSYGQIITDGKVLKGAVLINLPHEIVPLSNLISKGSPFSTLSSALTDTSVDLKTLL
jgi:NAD(P)H-nitrite reductase large subunit